MTNAAEVLIERNGSLGRIKLNRPKVLNSANINVIRLVSSALQQFAEDQSVAAVLITGEGDRAFCAGGDIRDLYTYGKDDPDGTAGFWREEYPVNYCISAYPKPYIAFMDRITMGAGVGLSAHGNYRVVTERTRLAMPETAIGYFPDVGASWLLSKAPGESGTWLGLTGSSVDGADAIYLGLADYFVPSEKLADLEHALSAASDKAEIGKVLQFYSEPPPPSNLQEHQALLDRVFAGDDLKKMFLALATDSSEFAQSTLQTLQSRSPTGMKLTLRLLREAKNSSGLQECLEREYHASVQSLKHHEFYEGIRAVVIDKDRNAKWDPPTIDGVDEDLIESFFPRKTETLVF